MNSTRNIQVSLSLEEQNAKKNAEIEEQLAAERNSHMQNIQREYEELQSVMTDIQIQVMDQAPKVDTIEDNTEKAADNTETAVDRLDEAQDNQQKRRKRIATIIVVLLSVALVIGGGALLGGPLGLSGTVGFLAGAAVMVGALAVVAGICYGIYSLLKLCMHKPEKRQRRHEEPDNDKKDHKSSRPSPTNTNTNEVTDSLEDKSSAEPEEPSLMRRGVNAAIKTGVAKQALFALPNLAASTLASGNTDSLETTAETGSTFINLF